MAREGDACNPTASKMLHILTQSLPDLKHTDLKMVIFMCQ